MVVSLVEEMVDLEAVVGEMHPMRVVLEILHQLLHLKETMVAPAVQVLVVQAVVDQVQLEMQEQIQMVGLVE